MKNPIKKFKQKREEERLRKKEEERLRKLAEREKNKKVAIIGGVFAFFLFLFIAIGSITENNENPDTEAAKIENSKNPKATSTVSTATDTKKSEPKESESAKPVKEEGTAKGQKSTQIQEPVQTAPAANTIEYNGKSYQIITVDGGDRTGSRQANVAVDTGFGDRVYWALTNEYGQLVTVLASEVILQDDTTEPVTSNGRYYSDEAKVPGVERDDLDEGHIIADSLGGVSNAYNITPQDSTLNRHGDQAYMEKVIRDAGGCKNFVATITYPDTTTQIPSHYHYEYLLNGEPVADDFDNVNPDEVNAAANSNQSASSETSGVTGGATPYVAPQPATNSGGDLASVDTNGNGQVTIAEAKAAGYSMPIYSDHWLYPYMDDRDGDGMVGE